MFERSEKCSFRSFCTSMYVTQLWCDFEDMHPEIACDLWFWL